MLIGQLTQDRRRLQVALSLWHARETTAQLSPDIQRRDTSAFCEGSQQSCLTRMGWADKQNELAMDVSYIVDDLCRSRP